MGALKTGYLFLYNMLQFLGFLWIFSFLTARVILVGRDALYGVFGSCSTVLYGCQMLALLEVAHAMLGLVATPAFPAMLQVVERNFLLFVIFGSLREMQNRAIVFCVFYLWSVIEIFRYPFYMLECVGKEWKALTWLRYTVWMPLYPLATLAEVVAVLQSLPIFDETLQFSVPLPKAMGLSVSFSFTLRLYLGLLLLGLFINVLHLIRQRRRRFYQDTKKDS